jgi:hypothetical protein
MELGAWITNAIVIPFSCMNESFVFLTIFGDGSPLSQ